MFTSLRASRLRVARVAIHHLIPLTSRNVPQELTYLQSGSLSLRSTYCMVPIPSISRQRITQTVFS